ncbi:MAG: NADPH-dependent 7-cyano-7-deazaguanine reductase QueF [Endomicrobiales bacterium]|nr:NADPH-dependent 7-cyano-7-deazaguanine reductase QueF [Endomicrobiales bacterium]
MKKVGAVPTFNKISPGLLEAIPYEYKGKRIEVKIESDEFTCLCPWTGLPDHAKITVSYVPAKAVIELKSLKYYLMSYRMVGMVHESVVNRVLADLVKKIKPKSMAAELEFKTRGGIVTTVSAQHKKIKK